MKSYKIHILRHGAIKEARQGAYIGITDVPLSQEGIEELLEIDKTHKYPGTNVIFTSPLQRCIQTCSTIYPALNPIVIEEFTELNFGDWEGKSASELKEDDIFKKWLANSLENSPPNGESGEEFTRRICQAFEKIVNAMITSGQTVAVLVTHGGIIMNLLAIYGMPQASPYEWMVDNGYGYTLNIVPSLWARDKVLEVYDVTPKLNEDDE